MALFGGRGRGGLNIEVRTNAKDAAEDIGELSDNYKELIKELDRGVELQALAKSLDDAYKAGKNVITALGQIDKRTKEGKAFHELSNEEQVRIAGIYKETKDSVAEVYGAMLESIQASEDLAKANEEVANTAEKVAESTANAAKEVQNYKEKTEESKETTSDYATFIDKFSSIVVKNSQKLNAEQRELRFTNALYEGMFHSLKKIINSTKILNGAVGLLSSAFGYIIDMIFLPLLPIAVALAEFLFGVGDAIHTVLDFISGINPVAAQLISLITLATGAMLLFLGGSFVSGVPGLTLLLEGVLNTIAAIKNGIKDVLINGIPETTPTATKTPDKSKPTSKTPSKLGGLAPAAATAGWAAAGAAIGTAIVSGMQLTGMVDVESDIGKALGLHDIVHSDILKLIPGMRNYSNILEGAGDITNFVQESVLGYFFPDFDVRLATTKNVVDRALSEGLYSPAVEEYLNREFGEGALHYESGDALLGKESGWFTDMGDKVTSYSSAQSSVTNYNNNYVNSVASAAFNLFHIAGL